MPINLCETRVCEVLLFFIANDFHASFVFFLKREIIFSNSVPQKKGEIPEDGLSIIQQQVEFMFGELMNRIEKLKTRFDAGHSKKGREARKEESVARNSADG